MTAGEFKANIIPLYGSMRSVALRYLREEDANDVVQDVLRKLWEIHAELNIRTNLTAYVLRIIKNRCLDILRSPVKTVPLDDTETNLQIDEDWDIIEHERYNRLEAALNTLDDRKRYLLELSLSGVKSEEIADKFSISSVNVRQILSRIRKELKRIMNEKN